MSPEIVRHEISGGWRIYRLPLEVFPGFWANAYLVVGDGTVVLVDVGSGLGESNQLLDQCMAEVRQEFDEEVGWDSLSHVLISHGHIDHFGGVRFVKERSSARIGVHELDLPVLIDYETRLELMERRLRGYLMEAGLSAQDQAELMDLYLMNKSLFQSVSVDFTYEAADMELGPFEFFHAPGHCPGQVVIRLEDALLTSDHVLPEVTPHQSPEALSLSAGLDHYLSSLIRLMPFADGARLILPGHGEPIQDLAGRVGQIRDIHLRRLERVLQMLETPRTIAEISSTLFPGVDGYHRLLAVEEAGAHVEYLHSRGFIGAASPQALRSEEEPIPYHRLAGSPAELLGRLDRAEAGAATESERRMHVQL
ncbi:MAG: MBL fold metallo-hydrolase [Anaerolineales bacterium]